MKSNHKLEKKKNDSAKHINAPVDHNGYMPNDYETFD